MTTWFGVLDNSIDKKQNEYRDKLIMKPQMEHQLSGADQQLFFLWNEGVG
ncbi:hypothetical protein [Peribacillus butanolivorans]|nr:hypothetical protein [Peribacillus butanolivorans]